jgi:hypothetical protein
VFRNAFRCGFTPTTASCTFFRSSGLVVFDEKPRYLQVDPMQSRSRSMKTVCPEYLGMSSQRSCQLVIVALPTRSGRYAMPTLP